jgi:diacylglycerol kinase (CTP)
VVLYRLAWPVWAVILFLLPILAGVALLDVARAYRPALRRFVPKTVLGEILRPHEMRAMSGSFWYAVGIEIVMLVTLVLIGPKPAVDDPLRAKAALSVLLLAFCDPAAGYFGKRWGGRIFPFRLVPGKSVEGSMGAMATGAIVTWLFYGWLATPAVIVMPGTALRAGLVGAVAEMLRIGSVDDNLTIPLFAFIGLSAFL